MKILLIAGNSPSPLFSQSSLAIAARSAGHDVIVGGIEWVLPEIAGIGLAPVQTADISQQEIAEFMANLPTDPEEEAEAVGRLYGKVAVRGIDPLLEMARWWRPDIVLGGPTFYLAPLVAHCLGVPSVRQEWDRVYVPGYDRGAREILQPLLDKLDLDGVPSPDLWIDICPPGLRPPTEPARQMMRWLPINAQRPLQPWMYAKGGRPRVYITAGARLFNGDALRDMALAAAHLDVEVVVGAPERVATQLRAELPEAHVGWIPLDVLAPTCDVIMHHGGGVTDMTALHAGVPQVIVNQDISAPAMQRLADYGAGEMLKGNEQGSAQISAACERVLANPEYTQRARTLSQEMAGLPPPAEIVNRMEQLAK